MSMSNNIYCEIYFFGGQILLAGLIEEHLDLGPANI